MTFGILTLATPNDYQKAIGLALSARISNPGVPIAVACTPKVRDLVSPFFDHVVAKDPSVHGFVHKLHLDRYTPFQETFFFDSDVLVFRDLSEVLDDWRKQPYSACGIYVTGGVSPFGFDRKKALHIIGKSELVHIDGAGHAYFKKPACHQLFELARNIVDNYRTYAGSARIADEDVMNIAMTILGIAPMPHVPFWSRYCSGRRGSVEIDATRGICRFDLVTSEHIQEPYIMHFAANEAPFVYTSQLRKLFRKFGVSTDGLLRLALLGYYKTEIQWPLKRNSKRLLETATDLLQITKN